MKDTIYRQDAIDAIMSEPPDAHYPSWYADILKELPSAQPESCGDVISKEYLKEHIEACWINGRPRYAPELNELLSWIDDAPSAQTEIIYCEDCKHWTNNIGDSELRDNYCNEPVHGFHYRCSGDDFCSYAKRRTDD